MYMYKIKHVMFIWYVLFADADKHIHKSVLGAFPPRLPGKNQDRDHQAETGSCADCVCMEFFQTREEECC